MSSFKHFLLILITITTSLSHGMYVPTARTAAKRLERVARPQVAPVALQQRISYGQVSQPVTPVQQLTLVQRLSHRLSGTLQPRISTIRYQSMYNKKPMFEQLHTHSGLSMHALLASLGLGWLWQSAEDKEKEAEQEKNAVLERCRGSFGYPLYEFDQFIKKYGDGIIAEQLFVQMIADDLILTRMQSNAFQFGEIPSLVIPFVKRHYYTLACNYRGSYVLQALMKSDAVSKKELTVLAVRDMEKLCEHAETDKFFSDVISDNPEAVTGLIQKAQGHIEQLVATKVGKQLIDNELIKHNIHLAKERATLLIDPSKSFDVKAFNTCMTVIKDDPLIESMIYKTYTSDDLPSLLKKMVYRKHCQQCIKDDLSDAPVSLKSLTRGIDSLAYTTLWNSYIVPDKGLSHMIIDALQKEEQYKDDYYIFYHGQPSKLGFQQRLFSWLATRSDDRILPVVYSLPQTIQEQRADDMQVDKHKGSMQYYSGERPYSLYAVADLFSNITLRLTATNQSAGEMLNVTPEQVCKDAHQEDIYALFKNELKGLEHEYNKLHKKGQLLQFRVKKDKLEQFVFASGDGGYDLKVKGVGSVFGINSIMTMFHDNFEKIENPGFAFGITIGSHLSNPKSGIACSIINSVDPKEWKEYEKKEKALKIKMDRYLHRKTLFSYEPEMHY